MFMVFFTKKNVINMKFYTCKPALADLDTASALDLPESLPALPPA
jgi:hypothetical protein